MTNEEAKDWEDALQKLKRINGCILFSQSGPDLLNMLTGDPPQNYGIPTTPARAIATHIHELKEDVFKIQIQAKAVAAYRKYCCDINLAQKGTFLGRINEQEEIWRFISELLTWHKQANSSKYRMLQCS